MGTEAPCCNTMLSEKSLGRLTEPLMADGVGMVSALAVWPRTATAASKAIIRDVKCMRHHARKPLARVKSALTAGMSWAQSRFWAAHIFRPFLTSSQSRKEWQERQD